MIFLGDIAHPFSTPPAWSTCVQPWDDQPAIVNLEGPITDTPNRLRKRLLTNHPSILPGLSAIGAQVAILANNHITDLASAIPRTRADLSAHGIQSVGAGRSMAEALAPATVDTANGTALILSFGWEAIHCKPPASKQPGVAPLRPDLVLSTIRETRSRHPQSLIVVTFHWNYELEPHPQPAHRQLAFHAVEAGADCIIGHHPHCVGGFETHRGAPIAYSLGNWWLPHRCFFNGQLEYPPLSCAQLALEWTPTGETLAHWFKYEPESHRLIHRSTKLASRSSELCKLTPYAGIDHSQYYRWHRANRTRRFLLPIYRDYRTGVRNFAKDLYLRLRHFALVVIRRSLNGYP